MCYFWGVSQAVGCLNFAAFPHPVDDEHIWKTLSKTLALYSLCLGSESFNLKLSFSIVSCEAFEEETFVVTEIRCLSLYPANIYLQSASLHITAWVPIPLRFVFMGDGIEISLIQLDGQVFSPAIKLLMDLFNLSVF